MNREVTVRIETTAVKYVGSEWGDRDYAASPVSGPGLCGWGLRVSSGEERLWADGGFLPGLQEEMQQALQLGEAPEGGSGLGAGPSGKDT